MATLPYKKYDVIYDYSAYTKSEVLLAGQSGYFDTVITGQVSPVHVVGDGSAQIDGLPFIERVEIIASANVDLEDLRITGNKVKIFNSSATVITVQTGTTASPTYENINAKCTAKAFFDGVYWRVEDGCTIGETKAWQKNLTATPLSLPWGWVACDGSTISDAESPFNGETLKDLNGDGRFLRGGATSGTEQADAFQGFKIDSEIEQKQVSGTAFSIGTTGGGLSNRHVSATVSTIANGYDSQRLQLLTSGQSIITDGVNGTPRTASETRPVNMTVVWIVKIK